MKSHGSAELPSDDETRFDRLVDGELSPHEYQALLAALDDEPDGWRRCALAFLEAQALGQELLAVRRGEVCATTAAKAPVLEPAVGDAAHWKQWLAMAASLVAALALGIALPGLWKSSQQPAVSTPAENDVGDADWPDLALQQPREIGSARLVLSGPGGQAQAGDVLIYEYSEELAKWLSQQEPGLPGSLISELERRGHRVQRQQQYVPVDLEDGRRAVIPVEAIQITPVSRRAY